LEQIQFLLGHVSVQTTERYLGCKQKLRNAVNDGMALILRMRDLGPSGPPTGLQDRLSETLPGPTQVPRQASGYPGVLLDARYY